MTTVMPHLSVPSLHHKTKNTTPAVMWAVAGSDSSGGAGVQADIKTAHDFAVHAATVITAITAQNSQQVGDISITSDESFKQQLLSLKQDIPPQAIKIGLLTSIAQVNALADMLRLFVKEQANNNTKRPFVVCDPVQIASTGDVIARPEIAQAIKTTLLPLIDLLTPNLLELANLAELECHDLKAQETAAKRLLALGCKGVLVKGGHDTGDYAVDRYYSQNACFSLQSKRLDYRHTHGTGCTLSSAIGAAVAKGYLLEDALVLGKAYINLGLAHGYTLGQGDGPIAHVGWPEKLEYFPTIEAINWQKYCVKHNSESAPFLPCKSQWLGLYPVVPNIQWLDKLLQAGVKTVQLRIKDPNTLDLDTQIKQAVNLGKQYQAQVFINDYWQLAIKHQAYGVHLGQEDMNHTDLEVIRAAGLRLGVSTHGYYELMLAKQYQPSYIALGHIFPTQTKDMPSNPQGLDNLQRYQALCEDIPTVAIGGISIDKVDAVKQTGVDGIAMVSAITHAEDWQAVVQGLLKKLAVPPTNHAAGQK